MGGVGCLFILVHYALALPYSWIVIEEGNPMGGDGGGG